MLITWLISASEGTRIPVEARSVLPVNSFTHSRITDLPVPPAAISGAGAGSEAAASAGGRRAVVIGSGSGSARVVAVGSSGKARLRR